ncbi:MAG: hypothetical protein HC904_17085 [Blastochloris sp.]|nr:hypothetical protein [Blastochloris sp.]
MRLRFGEVKMVAMRIDACHQGLGAFKVDEFTMEADQVRMLSSGDFGVRHRPGYELPLGRPVNIFNIEEWAKAQKQREYVPQEPLRAALSITYGQESSCELHYQNPGGLEGVLGQISLDFAAGTVWEQEGCLSTTFPGQVIFLKEGKAKLWVGGDYVEIDGGHCEHTTLSLRGTAPYPQGLRVLITFRSRADLRLKIRGGRGPRLLPLKPGT